MAGTLYQTTMKGLLTDLKSNVMQYARTGPVVAAKRPLTRVDTRGSWIRGVLSPKTRFPVVAFLPESEVVIRRQTGNQLHVERTVGISVYDKGLQADDVKRSVLELAEDTREAIKHSPWVKADGKYDPTMRRTAYWYDMGPVQIPQASAFFNGVLGVASFSVRFRSRETLASRTVDATYLATETDNLSDQIVSVIQAASSGWGAQALGEVKVVDSMDRAVWLRLPGIGIYPVGEEVQKDIHAGREIQNRSFDVWVVSKMLAIESALDKSLDLAEAVKTVLQFKFRFNGHAVNSEIGNVMYYTEADKQLYGVVIPLTVQSYERHVLSA